MQTITTNEKGSHLILDENDVVELREGIRKIIYQYNRFCFEFWFVEFMLILFQDDYLVGREMFFRSEVVEEIKLIIQNKAI